MPHKLKPVDDAPICDPAYVRRIDPVWMRTRSVATSGKIGSIAATTCCGRPSDCLRTLEDLYWLGLFRCYQRNRGKGLARYWGTLAFNAVRDCFPLHDWMAWLFPMVPQGFWESAANRRSYFIWLGKELGFRRPEDWYRIRAEDVMLRHGNRLLQLFPSRFYDLMRQFLPQLDWDRAVPRQPLSIQQILAWADRHYQEHGKWPTSTSGTIAGTIRTWVAIDQNLKDGTFGLSGASSLARLLEKDRGVCWGRRLPDLSAEQVLAWADEYFVAHGKWPGTKSGSIAGTPETWSGVDGALRGGRRGLPHGCLTKLLAPRRQRWGTCLRSR